MPTKIRKRIAYRYRFELDQYPTGITLPDGYTLVTFNLKDAWKMALQIHPDKKLWTFIRREPWN
jgi:hypothetical protein